MTIHEDPHGTPRVLFLLNPGDRPEQAEPEIPVQRLRDLVDGATFDRTGGKLTVPLEPRSIRMLAIDLA
jgi:beta-galactosidase